jgi:translation elongation factor P/translation initiation factor 5A
MTTTATKVQDLKKGDKVIYYGAIIIVTEDAKESKFFKGTFFAKCEVIDTTNCTEGNKDALIGYNSFQGNEKAIVNKIINN